MKILTCEKGQIFYIKDQFHENSYHNYIILSNDDESTHPYVQAMCITSMQNHTDIGNAVPLVLDEKISYILSDSIYSFRSSEIKSKNYHGCIVDDDYMTTDEFIDMLLDLYTYSITKNNGDAVMLDYERYMTRFNKENFRVTEYREFKKQNARRKPTRKDTNMHSRHQIEKRETNYTMKTVSKLEDMKFLNTMPRLMKNWNDKQLIMFITGYEVFGYNQISKVSSRYGSLSSMSAAYSNAKKEIQKRKK